MTKEDFYTYLVQPERMNEGSLEEFRVLVSLYPAFQSAWILYLKNLMMLGDPSFAVELKRAGIYIQNRKVLYLFLHKKSEKEYLEVIENKSLTPDSELLEIDYAATTSPYQLDSSDKSVDDELLSDLVESFRRKPDRKQKTLTDNFLEGNPLIKSGEEGETEGREEEFVSETLANIYARQGYYDKAIEVFEKLSLKYPEKNIYFAGQIEKIKNLKNN